MRRRCSAKRGSIRAITNNPRISGYSEAIPGPCGSSEGRRSHGHAGGRQESCRGRFRRIRYSFLSQPTTGFFSLNLKSSLNCQLEMGRSPEDCVCYVCGRTAYSDVRAFCACHFFNKLRLFNTGVEFDSPRLQDIVVYCVVSDRYDSRNAYGIRVAFLGRGIYYGLQQWIPLRPSRFPSR